MRKSILDKLRELKARKKASTVSSAKDKEVNRKDITFLPSDSNSTSITEHINSRIDMLMEAAGGSEAYEDKGSTVNFIDDSKGYIITIENTKTVSVG